MSIKEIDALPPGKKRFRRLDTMNDVKLWLARTCRKLDRGTIAPDIAGKLIYGLKTLADQMKTADLETRMAEIERLLSLERTGEEERVHQ